MNAQMLPWWMPLSVWVWAIQMVAYHGISYAFEYCDRNGLLRGFKVRNIDRKSYRQLMPRVLANQVFILLPCMMAVQALGLCFSGQEHLPLWRFAISLVAMGVGHDIVQYATHRYLLHRPSLIRTLRHSIHHSTGASKGISACYMSAPDFFLEIVLPYLLPLAIIGGGGSDIVFHTMIAGLGAFGGVYEHSGYDFAARLPKAKLAERMPRFVTTLGSLITSQAHGQHHVKGNVSFSDGFGSPGLCDSLLGTRWDQVEDKRREQSAVPPRTAVPVAPAE
jgi:sterol desaturase/sphingolipid hydroxylase (fatty acid hydroxylase superfamily)